MSQAEVEVVSATVVQEESSPVEPPRPPPRLLSRKRSVELEPNATFFQRCIFKLFSIFPPHVRRRLREKRVPRLYQLLWMGLTMLDWPHFPFMFADWKKYRGMLYNDIIAGLTVAVVLIPQGMSYALLASLKPIMGLYAATIAGYVYALLGSSGQLTIGPVALVSLFMSETFDSLGVSLSTKDKYASYVRQHVAPVISLAVGIMLVVLGALRLGRLMKFISPSMMTGFTTGSGVYIGLSQVKYMFGVKVKRQEYNYEEYRVLAHEIQQHKLPIAMKLGWGSFFVMLFFMLLKKAIKWTPKQKKTNGYAAYLVFMSSSTLLVLIALTLITQHLVNSGTTVPIIGEVPKGFNPFMAPRVGAFGLSFGKVVEKSIPLMLLCYMESVAVARKYALQNRYELDMNQEMWALGMGNVVASFFTAYPPGGSFSRTALKAELGVKTPVANVFTSLAITVVITCLTQLLYYVPQAFLGAVIDIAVLNLMDFGEMWHALWIAPIDFLVMLFTFVVTVFWSTELGLQYGILASIVVLVWQISKVDVVSIGQLKENIDTKACMADMSRYPEAVFHNKIRVLRLTANLFFGNVAVFRDEFYASLQVDDNHISHVIIDAQGVSNVDLSTMAVFDEMLDYGERNNVKVVFANVTDRLCKWLEAYEILDDVGGRRLVLKSLEDVFHQIAMEVDDKLDEEEGGGRADTTTRRPSSDKPSTPALQDDMSPPKSA